MRTLRLRHRKMKTRFKQQTGNPTSPAPRRHADGEPAQEAVLSSASQQGHGRGRPRAPTMKTPRTGPRGSVLTARGAAATPTRCWGCGRCGRRPETSLGVLMRRNPLRLGPTIPLPGLYSREGKTHVSTNMSGNDYRRFTHDCSQWELTQIPPQEHGRLGQWGLPLRRKQSEPRCVWRE